MVERDLFGINRESRIIESTVRDIFTPHSPINRIEFFFGRQTEVQGLLEQLNTPGQHSLLYGERGVGKSSLANVALQVLFSKLLHGKIHLIRCDSSTTFESIVSKPLYDVDIDVTLRQVSSTSTKGGKIAVNTQLIKVGI
jgi:MoxR-like ATPase